ncbi:MAG: efflux RND transporter periplasmic adaptor subunit [Limnobacter sp.]|nr:efflux RND transporter periplasmic adaptor subunit [Limnobacter sp.]
MLFANLRPDSLTRCVLLGSAIGLLLAACGKAEPDTTSLVRPVRVVQVQSSPAQSQESYPAQIEPRVEATLSFQVGGKLVERPADVGKRVSKGQLLARIDPKDLMQAQKAAQAQLDAARTEASQARTDLNRARELLKEGFVSQAELDRRKLAFDAAASRLQQAQAQYQLQQNQGQYSRLAAPADGVVAAVYAESGQVVAAGQPVVQWAKKGEAEARLSVPETRVNAFSIGQPAQVQLWSSSTRLPATVREVAPVADPSTRSYTVYLDLQNEPKNTQQEARYGMSATVYFNRAISAQAFRLPLSALVATQQNSYVWVFNEAQGTVNKRAVTPSSFLDDVFLVEQGLKPGEWVVTAGTHVLNEGQRVKRFIETPGTNKPAAARP